MERFVIKFPRKETVETIKLIFEMTIAAALIGILITALVAPKEAFGYMESKLRQGGWRLDVISLFGAEFSNVTKEKAETASDQLAALRVMLEDFQRTGELNAEQALIQLNRAVAETEEIRDVVTDAVPLAVAAAAASSQEAALELADDQDPLSYWFVILGADTTQAGAQDEVETAQAALAQSNAGGEVRMVFYEDFYNTVVRYRTEADARSQNAYWTAAMGRTTRVRSQERWCPTMRPSDDPNLYECP